VTSILDNRDQQRHVFVEDAGWANAQWDALTADASFRRYFRLKNNEGTALLMDAAAPHEDIDAYLDLTAYLRSLGFSVPEIYKEDRALGLALIEDFGDGTFTNLLSRGVDEETLYLLATDVLSTLHKNDRALGFDLPPYDMKTLMEEVSLFIEWYVPAFGNQPVSKEDLLEFKTAWEQVLSALSNKKETLVLRDYHVDNLMQIEGREGVKSCGLLDYQDAVSGPRLYDLVSLIEDARRDISPGLRQKIIDRYESGYGPLNADDIRDMAILGAQRHAKVAGIFVRLYKRDGKPVYLRHLPRVLGLLKNSLEHASLRPVKNITDRLVPDYSGHFDVEEPNNLKTEGDGNG